MQAGGVEPGDVFDDRELKLGAGAPDAIGDQLGLEAVDEALGHARCRRRRRPIRPRRGCRPRRARRCRPGWCTDFRVSVCATSSTSAPGPRWQIAMRSASRTSSVRMCDGELPADDPAAVGVQDEREEHHALPAAQVGEIADPEPIRTVGGEVALHEIRAPQWRTDRASWCATACRGAWRPGRRARASAAPRGRARRARRRAAAPSTCAAIRRRSSWPRAAPGCAPSSRSSSIARAERCPVARW